MPAILVMTAFALQANIINNYANQLFDIKT